MEQDRFTVEQWQALVDGPTGALGLVLVADGLGVLSFLREGHAAGRVIRSARRQHDWPSVVAELVEAQDRGRRSSLGDGSGMSEKDVADEARQTLARAGAAAKGLTPTELDAYVRWNLEIARAAARAVAEEGSVDRVSSREAAALLTIEDTLRSRPGAS